MDRLHRGLAVALLIANAGVLAFVLASAARLVPSWFDRPGSEAAAASAPSIHKTRHSPPGDECDHVLVQLRTAILELHGGHLPPEEEARIDALRGSGNCSAGSEEVEALRDELSSAFHEQGREPPEFLGLQ